MSFRNPHLAPQKDTLSVSSEKMPLYNQGAIKQKVALDEGCCHEDGSQLISLSGLLETAFNNQAESVTTNTTFTSVFGGSYSSITHGCPDNCPCVCHVQAPYIPFNQERPSVIMTPVAGRRRTSGVTTTHAPLQVRTGTVHYKLCVYRPTSPPCRRALTVRSRVGDEVGGGGESISPGLQTPDLILDQKMLLVAVPCIKEAPASNPTKIPRIVVGSLSKLPSAGRQILLVRLFETSRF